MLDWPIETRQRLSTIWPDGLPKPGAVRRGEATWDPGQFIIVRDLADAVDAPFDEQSPPRRRNDPQPQPPVEPLPDDGGPLDPAALDVLLTAARADGDVALVMNAWLAEGKAAGVPWQPRIARTVRSFEQARAAYRLAALAHSTDDGDDVARALLAAVLGEVAEWPTTPVGAAIGHLTLDEACRVADAADALGQGVGPMRLVYSDDGHPTIAA